MKWPSLLLLLFTLFLTQVCLSQQSFLFLKKNGHKKRTWTEGDIIRLRLVNDDVLEGRILLLRNDSIFINDLAFRTGDVKQVLLKRKEKKTVPGGCPSNAVYHGRGSAIYNRYESCRLGDNGKGITIFFNNRVWAYIDNCCYPATLICVGGILISAKSSGCRSSIFIGLYNNHPPNLFNH